jgi:hypothetical protein
MRLHAVLMLGALLFGVGRVSAESHPAWWRYASPEATALVGLQWEHLRSSPFASGIADELTGEGGLGFPDIECLKDARQILISSPELLAVATGTFPAGVLRDQATHKGWKRALYRDMELWITPGKATLSLARISDQLLLVGRVKTLQDAIDRSLVEQIEGTYSPLLARGASHTQEDLWVVASSLPDALAEHFIPIDAQAEGFEGGVSLQGGLRFAAVFTGESEEGAAKLADALKQSILQLPPVARGIQVNIDRNYVTLGLSMGEAQLLAGLKTTPAAPAAAAVVAAKPEPAPVSKPAGPQVIRIFGLDDGPREIVVR